MDKKNEAIHISVQQRIENYKEAYAKAKEAALACREVAFPRLLAMEALWNSQFKTDKNEPTG